MFFYPGNVFFIPVQAIKANPSQTGLDRDKNISHFLIRFPSWLNRLQAGRRPNVFSARFVFRSGPKETDSHPLETPAVLT